MACNAVGRGYVWGVVTLLTLTLMPAVKLTQSQEPCRYVYRSDDAPDGVLASPGFPADYPERQFCTYVLQGKPGERLRLKFNALEIEGAPHESNRPCFFTCHHDYLEVEELNDVDQPVRTLGRYCGNCVPPTLVTSRPRAQLTFVTDETKNYGGFQVEFNFITNDCGGTYRVAGGVLESPGYPGPVPASVFQCEWVLELSSPNNDVSVQFLDMDIAYEDAELQTYQVKHDVTGALVMAEPAKSSDSPDVMETSPDATALIVSFTSKTGRGRFRASWTQFTHVPANGTCEGFLCAVHAGRCIHSALVCNGFPNCGSRDNSDERDCQPPSGGSDNVVVGIVVALVLAVLLLIAAACVGHAYRQRQVDKRGRPLRSTDARSSTRSNRRLKENMKVPTEEGEEEEARGLTDRGQHA
ncbi:PREDICTED: cubilin-like [Branchiostoma belcheri]|uniref:Cubilin-like n=1 Tax=Branchiostoma belcheri TaxID=7741 RepID=A0A6P4XBX2_BRABE|nr:PREDICTED: cubilin-like [Branchiostoma belcheri]